MTEQTVPEAPKPSHKQLLYEPIVLEHALKKSCRSQRDVFTEPSAADVDSFTISNTQAFHSFVDKLSQVCDNQRGGATVTSFAVLKGPNGPEYVFGSNQRTEADLAEVQEFIDDLLHFVGDNPSTLKPKPLTKQVLWRILLFNQLRLQFYLKSLVRHLEKCIEDCERRNAPEELKNELEKLLDKVEFPRDSVSRESQAKFLSDCEKLIKAIVTIKSTSIDEAIRKNAKDGEFTNSETWCELRHYLGRLLSFRQAADVIVGARDKLPLLLRDFKVIAVPSSSTIQKPIAKSLQLSAISIICNMNLEQAEEETYLDLADEMQKFGLDSFIQQQASIRTFKPYVHAEILVHEYLVREGRNHAGDFWKGSKYIGGSKPTCRLCYYYFAAHPDKVQVRRPHMNLYPNWRLPGAFENHDSDVEDPKTLSLLEKIIESVREDAKKTLEDKCPQGKKHDSNTYTILPKYGYADSISMNDGSSQVPRAILATHGGRQRRFELADEDDFSIIGEADAEATDEEDLDGGVSVRLGYA
ncbi:hypothetical protein CPLU01_11142 [Colletotrichum plurivorum]|uniref:Uncharacterized protein n=1 Tax=Colletotrichum plurivorum TaxID=2175906 RepID=A0A8H6K3B2_9PEZI|nr:hypothetical protein CPLU01_11142 [Colletotrichum plurivorum]